jgi:hypothetical protein
MRDLQGSEITFAVVGGVFGVGRLATMLKGLADSGRIGPSHVGHWINFRHTAIRSNSTPVPAGKSRKAL